MAAAEIGGAPLHRATSNGTNIDVNRGWGKTFN
jgi:hypothetical protein